jgi:hypothetical protein
MINIYNATFIEIEACPRTLRTTLVHIDCYETLSTMAMNHLLKWTNYLLLVANCLLTVTNYLLLKTTCALITHRS